MGKNTSIFDLHKELALPISTPLTVVAADHQIEVLRSAKGVDWLESALFLECSATDPVPMDRIPETGVVILEVDPATGGGTSRIEQFHLHRPDVALVVAMAEADVRTVRMLVREGVADVVGLPFEPEEIFETLVAVLETSQPEAAQAVSHAPLVALLRATGGAGATTIATHLAAALADGGQRNVCLVDLDIQSGRVAECLGVNARRTLSDLFDAGSRLDKTLLESVVASHPSGIDVVVAPNEISPVESIEDQGLSRLLQLLRQEYDIVVIDLPADLTNWALSVLSRADTLIPVVEQSLGSIRHTRRVLDLFASLGLDRRLVMPVVNKVPRKLFKAISIDDVSRALGRDVAASLALEPQGMMSAQDQGILLGEAKSKSAFVAGVRQLADLVLAQNRIGDAG